MRPSVAWRLFERLAGEYDQVIPFFASYGASIMSVLSPSPGCRFLDLGAGRGALSRAALERGCRVVAVDAAATMVARLVDHFPSAYGCVRTPRRSPSPTAVSISSPPSYSTCCPAPDRAATEAHRVLAPGGRFALTAGSPSAGELSAHLDELLALRHIFPGWGILGAL